MLREDRLRGLRRSHKNSRSSWLESAATRTPLSLRVVEGSMAMDTTEETTSLILTIAEARVLGCLVEKEAATPDAYPLTVNAAQVAANQKTARDPVLALN